MQTSDAVQNKVQAGQGWGEVGTQQDSSAGGREVVRQAGEGAGWQIEGSRPVQPPRVGPSVEGGEQVAW